MQEIRTVFFNRSPEKSGETSLEDFKEFSEKRKLNIHDICIWDKELNFDFFDFENLLNLELSISEKIHFFDISNLYKLESLLITKSPQIFKAIINPWQFLNTQILFASQKDYDVEQFKFNSLSNYYEIYKADSSINKYKDLNKFFKKYRKMKEIYDKKLSEFSKQNVRM